MKNYIIVDGKAYAIKGQNAYLLAFDLDGKVHLKEEDRETIPYTNQEKYTFEEIYKKLNIRKRIAETKNKLEEDKLFQSKIDDATKTIMAENETLKKENESLKKEIESLKTKVNAKAKTEVKINKEKDSE